MGSFFGEGGRGVKDEEAELNRVSAKIVFFLLEANAEGVVNVCTCKMPKTTRGFSMCSASLTAMFTC